MPTTGQASPFRHASTSLGFAKGMSFSGKQWFPDSGLSSKDTPLIIAIHGGTYTSDYFDVPGYSLIDRAAANGIPIIALDRPGYGASTAVADSGSIIEANAVVLNEVVDELWSTFGRQHAGIVLIGHSIGGAVASAIAAREKTWPLLGLAISGCMLEIPSESREAWRALPDIPMIDLPVQLKDSVMFGHGWTHAADAKAQTHFANAPCPRAELIDITTTWPARVRETVARIRVPVHFRQGQFDALWVTDAHQVSAFAATFSSSPDVDAKLCHGAGHCIDFHWPGAAFQLEQLAFALRCSAPAEP